MDLQLYFDGIALLLIVFSGAWLLPLVGLAVAVADTLCHTMAASWRQNDQLFGRSRLAFSGISAHFRPRRHLLSATEWRTEMADRFAVGRQVTAPDAAA
jgi:hypothetical protein